ncbi:DUF5123 domain-containing protein [Maribellus sediminis]|uniref:DUF5123 domain-containing protein n=1 Tax=Maribellus sediminis TaxID=2696285 RepID=UPI001431A843|nr:DUF5123 domain-containing protein [Maribellus sediminis]
MKINIKSLVYIMLAGLLGIIACNNDDEVFERTRLFQPVLNEDLYSEDNTIIVNLGNMKQAENYFIEVSRDSGVTIDYSFTVDTNYFIIDENLVGEELLWYTLYQVQATANADESQYNSLPSFLGSVRTQKFPSNMGTPTYFDILDNRAKVFWTPSGSSITTIKVFAADDARLTNPLSVKELTEEEMSASEAVVGGLSPATEYQIAIFSGETIRGWEVYQTREALELGDNVIDLTGIDTMVNFATALADATEGAVVVLEGGKTYEAGGYEFNVSLAFVSGYSFVAALPVIDCNSNFNLLDGATVGTISFKDIKLTASDGGFGGRYVFNIDKSGTIDEIKFDGCVIRTLRGIGRMKGGEGVLNNYTINNCQIDSINGYGVISVDKNTWACNNITLKNSSISKCQYFLVSRNNTNSLTISDCTINEAPEKGRQLLRWREAGQDEVTNVSITNTIIGHGWNMTGEEDYAIDGFDGMASTNWNVVNCYTTGDFSYGEGKDEIPGLPIGNYTGSVNDLWTDPGNAIFEIKDNGFAGKNDSGDPRWRPGL